MPSVAIEAQDLHFRYDGTSQEVLRGISFRVNEGESVGIVGPNGAGKSTLLLHMNGILPTSPDKSQAVRVFGLAITGENLFTIRQTVGLLFQDPDDQLFCATVYEDVAFGPSQFGYSGEKLVSVVESALAMVDLKGYENRSPHHLSIGEKQRVCLAGILACQPKVLVLDEPTHGLDPRGKQHLKTILHSLPATKLIATHDLELVVEMCSRTLLIDGGSLITDGPTLELLSDESLMLSHGLEKPHILRHRHPH